MPVKHTILPVFLDHAGCRFRCEYCDQRGLVGKPENSSDQIDRLLSAFRPSEKRPTAHLAFYGGDYLKLPEAERLALLAQVDAHPNRAAISGFRASVRPDSCSPSEAGWLADHGFRTIEIGAQCLDDRVLETIRRGHTVSDVENAAAAIRWAGMVLGLQLMLGLPGQTHEITCESNRRALSCAPNFVRLFPTVVLKNTGLSRRYESGQFVPMTNSQALMATVQSAAFFRSNNVRIAQIGLHPSEPLVSGRALVAGPFHPRFGEMVRERLATITQEGAQ